MSVVLRDRPPRLLPLAAGVAVAELAGEEARRSSGPTTSCSTERKVAGILVEGRPQEGWAVLGIGLNVAVRARTSRPSSSAGRATARSDVLDARFRPRRTERARDSRGGGTGDGGGHRRGRQPLVPKPDGGRVTLDAGEVHLGSGPA